jgi:hypothetical protein
MPRRKPEQVITHRIELGTWERTNIGKPISDTAQTASVLSSVGIGLLGAGAAAAAYALWEFWKVFDTIKDEAVDLAEDIGENPWYYSTGTPRKILQKILFG